VLQHDIDTWFDSGASTGSRAQSPLYWAINARRVKGLKLPPHGERNHPAIGEGERMAGVSAGAAR